MNWTGGTLSRSRNINAKASISVKQKNYFAKARVKLQSGQRKSPPDIQYFDFGEWKPKRSVPDDRHLKTGEGRASSQRTLDQYQNVQGVVRKLTSLRPKNEGKKRKRSVINDAEGYVLPSGIPIPPLSPTIIDSHQFPSPSPIQAESTREQVVKQRRTSRPSTSDESYPLANLDSVEAKRRRLLQETDWVGIERQRCLSKPAKMKFTDAEDRDLIGRRRPLKGSAAQNRWNVQGSRPVRVPLLARCDEKDEGWNPDEMSIRIGSTAASKRPIVDEMLDCYQSSENKYTGHTSKPQHRLLDTTSTSNRRRDPSEPFRSLFSPEEVEQSGVAQLIEASTIADDDNPLHMADELQLPEDYKFPEPEPGFHFAIEQTLQPRDQTPEFEYGSDPTIREITFAEEKPQALAVELKAHPGDRNVLQDRNSQYTLIEDAIPSTSPLSIATCFKTEIANTL